MLSNKEREYRIYRDLNYLETIQVISSWYERPRKRERRMWYVIMPNSAGAMAYHMETQVVEMFIQAALRGYHCGQAGL